MPQNTSFNTYVLKTLHGLEEVLAQEVKSYGGSEIEVGNRSVTCKGDLAFCYRLNYSCRTALSVLTPIKEGKVPDEKALYDLVSSIQWHQIFDVKKTFLINVVCYSDLFRNSHFLALKAKDAIVDQFRDRFHRRPSISKDPQVKINIFIKGDDCTISMDTSGGTLFKRGYRIQHGEAPINEVLAAGLLKMSDWKPGGTLVDPMCGSGTFLFEAAMIQRNIPPQILRNEFSFQHLNNYDPQVWKKVKDEALSEMNDHSLDNLAGHDINRRVLNFAKSNAANGGFEEIQWKKQDFFKWEPAEDQGVLIFNPPYDERLPLEDAIGFYKRIGDQLKWQCKGWKCSVISSHLQAVKHIGLKPKSRKIVFNGPLECRFVSFEMY